MKICVLTPIPAAPFGTDLQEDIDRLTAVGRFNDEVYVHYVESGPPTIEGDYEDSLAVPGTVSAAIEAEKKGADGIVINCTADTGLDECRECVSIPVVAPMMASMHLAAELAHKFSVLTFSNETYVRFENMAWRWGLWHKFASVHTVGDEKNEIEMSDVSLVDHLFTKGRECVEVDGAHAIILGCTAFEIVSQQLRDRFSEERMPVLIIDPYITAFRQVEMLMGMNIAQSKLTYPHPKILSTL